MPRKCRYNGGMRAFFAMTALAIATGFASAEPADTNAGVSAPFWRRLMDPSLGQYEIAAGYGDQLLAAVEVPAGNGDQAHRAYLHYKMMATRWPFQAMPHLRLGGVIVNLMRICRPDCGPPRDRALAEEALAHWRRFEELAPGDPDVYEMLFERAIIATKLGGEHLDQAAADYRQLLARGEAGVYLGAPAVLHLNLAEVLMMQGALDESIDEYRVAVALAREPSSIYGLAVALDRAGFGEEARRLVRDAGVDAFKEYHELITEGSTFYVPAGEVYYYLGVVHEALGKSELATTAFAKYLESGANPQFAPQAKAHLQRLARPR